jgi:OOP family OmpA-OmpF porin
MKKVIVFFTYGSIIVSHKIKERVMKRIIILVSVLIMFVAASGYAQVKAGSVSITPFIGGYLFEGNQNLEKNNLAVGLRAGYNFTKNWGVEGFFNYVPTKVKDIIGDNDLKLYGYGVEALYHFMPEKRLVPFLAVGAGGSRYSPPGAMNSSNKFTVDYGAGLKFFLTDMIALRADVRHVLPLNDRYNDLLYTFGINFSFGGAKKTVAAARAAEPAAAAEVVVDSDRDGVPDNMDKCPGTPEGVKVDRDGCPMDSDKDGVYDYLDKCPGTPEGVKVDQDGCPLDSDKDGIPDYLDKCPGTPAGVKVDSDGCPPPVVQEVKKEAAVKTAITEKGRATLNVEFEFDKANIKKNFYKEIDELAEVMKEYPDIKIVIEGHTDNRGSAAYNQKLSQERAEAVKKYMVDKCGIDSARLTTKGFGLTNPIASNTTKEGRQKNRRVEAATDYIIKK